MGTAEKLSTEEFADLTNRCEGIIGEAVKILQIEPAIMTYFGLCELQPVNEPGVTLRLATRNSGSTVYMQYNPAWLIRLTDPSILAFLFAGETLRIALHHCTTRRSFPIKFHKLASDLLVYEDQHLLSKWRDSVKDILPTIPTYAQVQPILAKTNFNKSADWTLEKLIAAFRQAEADQQQQSQGDKGDGKAEDEKEGESESQGKGESESQTNSNGDGREDGDPRGESVKGKGQGDCASALDEYFDSSEAAARKAEEEYGENDHVDEKVQQITEHIASDVSRWGNISGALKEAIMAANKPKFDPSIVAKHFKQSIQSEEMYDTRAKTNRRHGDALPGWRHKMKSSMLVAIDCSGSMSDEDVALGEAFMNLFIKHCKTSYCFWDGECGPIEELKRSKAEYELIGRGYTNPQCVLDKLDEDKEKFGGILYFTDNGFNWPRPKSKWANKIFIISTHGACKPPEWVKWHLNMDEIKEYMEK